jgi:hypothetical protein
VCRQGDHVLVGPRASDRELDSVEGFELVSDIEVLPVYLHGSGPPPLLPLQYHPVFYPSAVVGERLYSDETSSRIPVGEKQL